MTTAAATDQGMWALFHEFGVVLADCLIVTAVLVAALAPFADPPDGGGSSAPTPRGIDHA